MQVREAKPDLQGRREHTVAARLERATALQRKAHPARIRRRVAYVRERLRLGLHEERVALQRKVEPAGRVRCQRRAPAAHGLPPGQTTRHQGAARTSGASHSVVSPACSSKPARTCPRYSARNVRRCRVSPRPGRRLALISKGRSPSSVSRTKSTSSPAAVLTGIRRAGGRVDYVDRSIDGENSENEALEDVFSRGLIDLTPYSDPGIPMECMDAGLFLLPSAKSPSLRSAVG